jgi:large conductance mechanosensitive channel
VVKGFNKLKQAEEEAPAAPPPPPEPTAEEKLLTEIRDLLKAQA